MTRSDTSPTDANARFFCSAVSCEFHIELTIALGSGAWAVRSDGLVTSRCRVAGRYYCDRCARVLEISGTDRAIA